MDDFEEPKRSGWVTLLVLILILIVTSLLFVYWFVPFDSMNFGEFGADSNFSIEGVDSKMQFYENLRFPETKISYLIYDCPLQKKNDMEGAFDIIRNKTVLEFYPVASGQQISVTCDSKNKLEKGMFIAGEGGPTNITKTQNFNVIFQGKILLLKDSTCPIPNVAIHELLHVLGFDHSANSKNIMFNTSRCGQTIGDDILNLIDKLYAFESLPDLTLENVSAVMNGKYLDVNISVRNNGLKDSEDFKIKIYADEKVVKEIDVKALGIGYGTALTLSNLFVSQFSVDELSFEIEYPQIELNKKNNRINLK